MKCWLPDALTHISNTTVTWCRGIEVEDWRNKKCFPDPPKFVRSGNLDLCVWLGFCSGLSSCPALPCCRVICSCCESWFCAEFSSNCGDTATSGWDEHQTLQKCIHSPARSCSLIRSYRGNTITAGRDRNWDLDSCQPLVCSKLPAGCLLCRQQWWGHTGWAGPCSTAAVSLSGDWEVPHCMQHPLITCSLTANCYMLSRAGVDILTVQG